jgi:cell division protein ZipA
MNWSLMLNVLLLVGVVVAIVRTVQTRRQHETQKPVKAAGPIAASTNTSADEIIAVRKVGLHNPTPSPSLKPNIAVSLRTNLSATNVATPAKIDTPQPAPTLRSNSNAIEAKEAAAVSSSANGADSIMIFLLAKSNRQLAGYELLQAVLSAGFRFGEGGLFHRHQLPNCQGPIMCSLAAATPTGVFDLQNIGAFVVHGLCLFMQISGSREIDAERFDVMLDTARTLSESLDTYLLDESREQLSEQSIAYYYQRLMLNEEQSSVE